MSMLERTILDLGSQLYELKGSFERSKEHTESLRSTLFSIKLFLDQEGIVRLEEFDEEMALIQNLGHDEGPDKEYLSRANESGGSNSQRARKQRH
jgi:hypothetical protein